MRKNLALGGFVVAGGVLLLLFQNAGWVEANDYWGQDDMMDDEIVVVGQPTKFGWTIYDQVSMFYDADAGVVWQPTPELSGEPEIVVEAPRPCSEVKQEMSKLAGDLNGESLVAIGDIHGKLTSGELIDLVSKVAGANPGACFFVEYPPDQGDLPARYAKVESAAQAMGMSSTRMDQAWNYYQRDGSDVDRSDSFELAQSNMTPEQSALKLNTANARDALMANVMNSAKGNCSKLIALVGAGHLSHEFDDATGEWATGRQNLKDLLGSGLKVVDGSPLLSCKKDTP